MHEHRPFALVVDDEPLIAMNAVDMLESLGFEAVETFDAAHALDALRQRDVDLLFTDIDMPGTMNGIALADFAKRQWPNIRIVIASGRMVPDAGQIPSTARFLTKPYNERQIALALKGMF